MPRPIALCLEDLDASHANERYHQCVAVTGRLPGLGINLQGLLGWQAPTPIAAELWVSADERLILFRPTGAPPIRVRRAGRELDAPFEKPVVLLGGDELNLLDRRFKVHVHGFTATVHAPRILIPEPTPPARSSHTAAVVALGAALTLGACSGIEVRQEPPKVATTEPDGPSTIPEVPPDQTSTPQTIPELQQQDQQPPPIELIPAPPQVAHPIPVEPPPPIEVIPMPPAVAPPQGLPLAPPPPEPEDSKKDSKK